jgi:hypothetical protein
LVNVFIATSSLEKDLGHGVIMPPRPIGGSASDVDIVSVRPVIIGGLEMGYPRRKHYPSTKVAIRRQKPKCIE